MAAKMRPSFFEKSVVLFTDRMVTNCPIQLHKKVYSILWILSSTDSQRVEFCPALGIQPTGQRQGKEPQQQGEDSHIGFR